MAPADPPTTKYHKKAPKSRKTRFRQQNQRRAEMMEQVAEDRITSLMQLALEIHQQHSDWANRYVLLARRIAMATKIRIPLIYKRYICHGCKQLIVPGSNMRFRIHRRHHYGTYLTITCLGCGHITRYILKGRANRRVESKSPPLDPKASIPLNNEPNRQPEAK